MSPGALKRSGKPKAAPADATLSFGSKPNGNFQHPTPPLRVRPARHKTEAADIHNQPPKARRRLRPIPSRRWRLKRRNRPQPKFRLRRNPRSRKSLPALRNHRQSQRPKPLQPRRASRSGKSRTRRNPAQRALRWNSTSRRVVTLRFDHYLIAMAKQFVEFHDI